MAASKSYRFGAIDTNQLFRRADDTKCGEPSFTPCDNPKLPDNFCCPAQTTCISLDNDRSMLCCPAGSDCQFIEPITCDITLQNATEHPRNPVHNTDLTRNLPKCGSLCCPQGFSCVDGQCSLAKDDKKPGSSPSAKPTGTSPRSAPSTSKVTLSTPGSAPATATSTSTGLPDAAQSPSTDGPVPSDSSNGFPAKAVIAGFFPGLLLGGLIVLAIFLCMARRKKKISAPLQQPNSNDNYRSDFLRSTPPRATFAKSRPSRPSILPTKSSPAAASDSTGAGSGGILLRTPLFRSGSHRFSRNHNRFSRPTVARTETEMARHKSESASIDVVLGDPLTSTSTSNPFSANTPSTTHAQGLGLPAYPSPFHNPHSANGHGQHHPHHPHQHQQHHNNSHQLSPSTYSPLRAPFASSGGAGAGRAGADNNTFRDERGLSQMTAFTDLMETAGFKKGEPFLNNASPSPTQLRQQQQQQQHGGAGGYGLR